MQNVSQNEKRADPSELVLNADGSVYHLALHPDEIADRILLVGDPGRVEMVSRHFDRIEVDRQNREFVTRTGSYKGRRLSVISSGIGTDNIDIVVNELDVLANYDLEEGRPRSEPRSLELIRVGTSGALQPDIPVDSFLLSEIAVGMDGLMHAYGFKESERETGFRKALKEAIDWPQNFAEPYAVEGDAGLLKELEEGARKGITLTAHGFYGLQGRSLRLPLAYPDLNDRFRSFSQEGLWISNFEMESSALYGIASSLGHRAATICLIIANRSAGKFSADHEGNMERLIQKVLTGFVKNG